MTLDEDFFESVLCQHVYSYNGVYSCGCGVGNWPSWSQFRSHLARELAHEVALRGSQRGCSYVGKPNGWAQTTMGGGNVCTECGEPVEKGDDGWRHAEEVIHG